MRITAVVGSYRKGGVTDAIVYELLAAARENGGEVRKVNLIDEKIDFCTNCRCCTQVAGSLRGACPIEDSMGSILDKLEASDGFVLASPTNFGTVTALMKRFIERLICYGYWPWGRAIPENRIQQPAKRAVVVTSCAAPAWMGRHMMSSIKVLKQAARVLGAANIDVLVVGKAAGSAEPELSGAVRKRAGKLGRKLAGQRKEQRAADRRGTTSAHRKHG